MRFAGLKLPFGLRVGITLAREEELADAYLRADQLLEDEAWVNAVMENEARDDGSGETWPG